MKRLLRVLAPIVLGSLGCSAPAVDVSTAVVQQPGPQTPVFSWFAVNAESPDALQPGAVIVVKSYGKQPIPIALVCKADDWLGKDRAKPAELRDLSASAKTSVKAAADISIKRLVDTGLHIDVSSDAALTNATSLTYASVDLALDGSKATVECKKEVKEWQDGRRGLKAPVTVSVIDGIVIGDLVSNSQAGGGLDAGVVVPNSPVAANATGSASTTKSENLKHAALAVKWSNIPK